MSIGYSRASSISTVLRSAEGKRCLLTLQKTFIAKAKEIGWKVDNTSDLVRLLRIPGTFNFKRDPVMVEILEESDGPI